MRAILSATQAKELLEREFASQKPGECMRCRVPTPFWGPGAMSGTGYWYLKMLPPCEHQCARVISKLWAQITSEYQIERSAKESGRARYEVALETSGSPRRRASDRASGK